MVRKTQTLVTLNAKIQSVNIKTVATDGSVDIPEGAPFVIDSNNLAALPGAASPDGPQVVFLNFTDSARTDVTFLQGDPTDSSAPTMGIRGGGLAGIVGNGCEIGLPASCWSAGALPTVGEYVRVDATTHLFDGVSATQDDAYHGIVHQITNGRAFFLFHSCPFVISATG